MGTRHDVLDGTSEQQIHNQCEPCNFIYRKGINCIDNGYNCEKESLETKIQNWLSYLSVGYSTSIHLFYVISTQEKIQSWVANGDLEFAVSNAEKRNRGAFDARRLDVNAMAMILIIKRFQVPHRHEGTVRFLRQTQTQLIAPS